MQYLPAATQFAALGAVLVIAAAMTLLGRALAGGGAWGAELLVGWAAVAALFTFLGTLTPLDFRWIAALALLGTLAAIALHRPRLPAGGWRLLVLLVPLFVVTASMQATQWDEISQWLPNARYLLETGRFPGIGRPETDSLLPAYPYALPLVTYLASLLSGSFAETAVAQLNLLLLASTALLLLRLIALARGNIPVGWSAAALALLATTLLSPSFVPKLVLTAYADTATAVAAAFAAVLGWRLIEDDPGEPRRPLLVGFAASLALLPMLKQSNAGLFLCLLAGLAAACLLAPRGRAAMLPVVLAALPAVALHALWRLYVGREIGGGEVAIRAFEQWNWALVPQMVAAMGWVAFQKIGHFGLAAVIVAVALRGLRRPSPQSRLALVFAVAFVLYTLFLAFSYVAAFGAWEAGRAASFWRYSTHLGLLGVAVAVYALAQAWPLWAARPVLGAACVLVALLAPVIAAPRLRFDLEPEKLYLREVATDMRSLLGGGARIAVLDPAGDGFDALFLDYLLGSGRQVALSVTGFTAPQAAAALDAARPTHIWIRSTRGLPQMPLPVADLPANASHLLARQGESWLLLRSWKLPEEPSSRVLRDAES